MTTSPTDTSAPLSTTDLHFGQDGLLPVVVQHHASGEILMVGFANEEAVQRSLRTHHAWFFSRSRGRLWEKGETSGHFLDIVGIRADCDADTLVYLCRPAGPTCHTGRRSCFYAEVQDAPLGETSGEAAAELFRTIKHRQIEGDASSSYVARLLSEGVDRIGKKVGEEATEVVIAAKNGDRAELAHEVADLWFHTFILLAQQGMTPEDIWDELRSRRR